MHERLHRNGRYRRVRLYLKKAFSADLCVVSSEPEGMSAPEVIPVNSSAARVLWLPPRRPNGAVTGYHVYVNDHLHGVIDNSSGSFLLGNLLPFTVYNIQVHTESHTHASAHKFQLCLFKLNSGGGVYRVRLSEEQRYPGNHGGGPAW